jgi:hypothetical protein
MNQNNYKLDNYPAILNYKFKIGIHFYPIVRFELLNHSDVTSQIQLSNKSKRFITIFKNLKYLKFSKKKFVFFTSTLFNIKIDNKYLNILDDYYYNIIKDDCIIYEDPDKNYEFRTPKINGFSSFFFFFNFIINTISRFNFSKSDHSEIDNFCHYLILLGVNDNKVIKVKNILINYSKSINLYCLLYNIYFKIFKPNLIFVNCGAYGMQNAILILIAHKNNIKVAEIQHGIISTSAIPYNFAPEFLMNKTYNKYYPDFILTFGNFWNSKMNNFAKIITIGHPHLTSIINNSYKFNFEKDTLLVVSQPNMNSLLIPIILNLKNNNNYIKISYRRHPKENLNLEQYNLLINNNIKIIDPKSDIYNDFLSNEYIFGCYSMSLIEAVAFNKKIIILDNEESRKFVPKEVGFWINDHVDILNCMSDNLIYLNNKNEFWNYNFENNLVNFISKYNSF